MGQCGATQEETYNYEMDKTYNTYTKNGGKSHRKQRQQNHSIGDLGGLSILRSMLHTAFMGQVHNLPHLEPSSFQKKWEAKGEVEDGTVRSIHKRRTQKTRYTNNDEKAIK